LRPTELQTKEESKDDTHAVISEKKMRLLEKDRDGTAENNMAS
jgi:hypothetical protein